jgi:hypothetical protein
MEPPPIFEATDQRRFESRRTLSASSHTSRALRQTASCAEWQVSWASDVSTPETARHGRSITFQMAEVMCRAHCSGRSSRRSPSFVHCRRLNVERRWPQRSRKPTAARELRPNRGRRRLLSAPTANIGRSDPPRAPTRRRHRCKNRRIANTLTAGWPDRTAIWDISVQSIRRRTPRMCPAHDQDRYEPFASGNLW